MSRSLEVVLDGKAGMCFGVRHALDMAVKAAEEHRSAGRGVCVVGQLVHNPQASAWLGDKGIREITEAEFGRAAIGGDVMIIPSHGKGPQVYDRIKEKGGILVDAVCPFVSGALRQARQAVSDGYYILIYGDEGHDEVAAYRDWLSPDCRVAGDSEGDLGPSPLPPKLALMAQTTADPDGYDRLAGRLRDLGRDPLVLDTICRATRERRQSAGEIAARVDLMLVVGGRNSANTRRLGSHCRSVNEKTFPVETRQDIDLKWLNGIKSIGITAGASTPEWIIKEVVDMMDEFKDQELQTEPEGLTDPEVVQESEAVSGAEPESEAVAEEEAAQEAEGEPGLSNEPEADGEPESEGEIESAQDEAPQSEVEPDFAPQSEEAEDAAWSEAEQEAEADFSEMEAEMGYLEFNPGDLIKGTVVRVSSDEVLVDIGYKSEGIIPAFELAFTKVDPATVVNVGDEISVEVLKEDRDGNIVLSRKNALFEEKINHLEELFEKGEAIEATVIDVVKGGLLVDVGMRGFVPASHVERGFVKDLNEYLKQTLKFKILELNRQGRKVILSRKALLEEEYQKIKEAFWDDVEEGQTRKGLVKRLTDFGAFVDIGGCDGLLHVSEMGWGKVGKPYDVVSINDEIEVFVLKVDREKEKVSLSLKKLLPNPWDLASEKYKVGEVYDGIVMRGASFGAFIQLEPSLEGLAHISQLARFRVNKVEDVLTEGMTVPVKILDIDLEKRRISLSIKEVIDLPKLVKDEPQDEGAADVATAAEVSEEAVAEAIDDLAEATVPETLADAIGEAAAEALAEAVAGASAGETEDESEE